MTKFGYTTSLPEGIQWPQLPSREAQIITGLHYVLSAFIFSPNFILLPLPYPDFHH